MNHAKHQQPGDPDDKSKTNLIVNYLPQSMSDSELFSMFITLGPIKHHRVARDHRYIHTAYSDTHENRIKLSL